MKMLLVFIATLSVTACSSLQSDHKQRQVQLARQQADEQGSSEPLYNLFESCLNTHWEAALDQGAGAIEAYEAGRGECVPELAMLCDYYAIGSCQQDAENASRVLFFLLREQYVSKLNP